MTFIYLGEIRTKPDGERKELERFCIALHINTNIIKIKYLYFCL